MNAHISSKKQIFDSVGYLDIQYLDNFISLPNILRWFNDYLYCIVIGKTFNKYVYNLNPTPTITQYIYNLYKKKPNCSIIFPLWA